MITSLRRHRRNRFAAFLAITLAGTLMGGGLVNAAPADIATTDIASTDATSAAPPVGPDGPIDPEPDEPTAFGVTGKGVLKLGSCVAAPGQVSVKATWSGGSATANATATATPGTLGFELKNLPQDWNVLIKSTIAAGVCKYGTWNPASLTVATPSSPTTVQVGTLTYKMPTKVVTVSGPVLAALLQAKLADSKVHLDNFGPLHDQSHHLPNGSSVTVAAISQTFTIPEFDVDLDCGWLCPDVGTGRFYVNDLDLSDVTVNWAAGALEVDLGFESAGHEIKGYRTNVGFPDGWVVSDNQMPDANIDNAHLKVALRPAANGGSLSYVLASTPAFTGDIEATGPCSFTIPLPVVDNIHIDICDGLFGYKTKIRSAVEGQVGSLLGASTTRAALAARLKSSLTGFGITNLTSVVVEGDTVVLIN